MGPRGRIERQGVRGWVGSQPHYERQETVVRVTPTTSEEHAEGIRNLTGGTTLAKYWYLREDVEPTMVFEPDPKPERCGPSFALCF